MEMPRKARMACVHTVMAHATSATLSCCCSGSHHTATAQPALLRALRSPDHLSAQPKTMWQIYSQCSQTGHLTTDSRIFSAMHIKLRGLEFSLLFKN
jgi:hypothetical protein